MVGAVGFENTNKRTFNDLQAPDDTVGAATTQSARKQSAFRAQKFSVGDACSPTTPPMP
jgi:hypothetical protein